MNGINRAFINVLVMEEHAGKPSPFRYRYSVEKPEIVAALDDGTFCLDHALTLKVEGEMVVEAHAA